MTLSEKRQGEIALAILKVKFRKKPTLPNPEEMKRNIGNVSKEVGISQKELAEFSILLVKELTEEYISEMEKVKDK